MEKKLQIGLIDADLLDNGTRHPNLAQMKISAFCKQKHSSKLLFGKELGNLQNYDAIIVSKVFTYTKLPEKLQELIGADDEATLKKYNTCIKMQIEILEKNQPDETVIMIGGTGFFSDGGRDLHKEIEHIKPDYGLYSGYIDHMVASGKKRSYFKDYEGYSIGFTTRGCHRKCDFCVNKKYDKAFIHSPVSEFLDDSRRGIYLWDDNFFSCKKGRDEILDELIETGKPFQFRQGLDIRLLNENLAKKLSRAKYHGDFIFAFDHYKRDKPIICKKLKLWRDHCKKETKLYVLCAFDPPNLWAKRNAVVTVQEGQKSDLPDLQAEQAEYRALELNDIIATFERIKTIMEFGCLPYIMRYEAYKNSYFRGMYTELARWCNQPRFFKKMSFREFCEACQKYHKNKETHCSSYRAMIKFEEEYPEEAGKYFDLKFESINMYKQRSCITIQNNMLLKTQEPKG